MTPERFSVLARLIHMRGGRSQEAARLVLVEGLRPVDAASTCEAGGHRKPPGSFWSRAFVLLMRLEGLAYRRKLSAMLCGECKGPITFCH